MPKAFAIALYNKCRRLFKLVAAKKKAVGFLICLTRALGIVAKILFEERKKIVANSPPESLEVSSFYVFRVADKT